MVAPPMSLLVAHNMSRAIAEGTKVLCPLTNPRESTSKATNDPHVTLPLARVSNNKQIEFLTELSVLHGSNCYLNYEINL